MWITRVMISFALLVSCVVAQANPDPQKGRFVQRDPKSSGQPVLSDTTWFMGRAPYFTNMAPDARMLYADGMNRYEYLGSNPITRSDPSGLSWDPFELVDQIGLEHELSGFIAMAKINSFIRDKQVLRKIRAYERGAFLHMDMIWDRDVGILFSVIGAPFFSRICFVEGTEIVTADGRETIECLSIGREVVSRHDPEGGMAEIDHIPRPGETMHLVKMQYAHGDGSTTVMEVLRPAGLIARLGLAVGRQLPVLIPEMGISGGAVILSIERFDKSLRLDIPVVTGRFVTDAAETVDVYFKGHDQPLGVTPKHPVFSVDRNTWVASAELQPGERLKSVDRTVTVDRVAPRPGRPTVYNVEISLHHTYFVGPADVWAHNPCKLSPDVRPRGGASGLKGAQWPAVRRGEDVFVAASHGHARHLASGGNGTEWVGKIQGFVLDGYVEFLDDLGTAWRWLTK